MICEIFYKVLLYFISLFVDEIKYIERKNRIPQVLSHKKIYFEENPL